MAVRDQDLKRTFPSSSLLCLVKLVRGWVLASQNGQIQYNASRDGPTLSWRIRGDTRGPSKFLSTSLKFNVPKPDSV
jgi:hypothetical protein